MNPQSTNNMKPVTSALIRMSPLKVSSTLPMNKGNVAGSPADKATMPPQTTLGKFGQLYNTLKSRGYNPWSLKGTY